MIRLTAVIEVEGRGPKALTHESNAREIIMGRDNKADFQIPLTTVSRHHARIREEESVYVFEDLGSTHGSLINGKKLGKGEKKVLRDGDIIELTKARITCNIQVDQVAEMDPGEGTQAIASKAVAGILGRLGEAQSEGPYFRAISGADEGTRFALKSSISEWVIGRSKDCEIVLSDANVSRRHATLKRDWNGFIMHDLGSKNGVVINGLKIDKPTGLTDHDEITMGPVKLVFVDPDADLMASLADVPGFETVASKAALHENDPSVMGSPNSQSGVEPQSDTEENAEDDEAEGNDTNGESPLPTPFEGDDPYAGIDPALLDTGGSRLPTDTIVIVMACMVAIGTGILLIALLL